jgi:hypothetical protein
VKWTASSLYTTGGRVTHTYTGHMLAGDHLYINVYREDLKILLQLRPSAYTDVDHLIECAPIVTYAYDDPSYYKKIDPESPWLPFAYSFHYATHWKQAEFRPSLRRRAWDRSEFILMAQEFCEHADDYMDLCYDHELRGIQ